MVTKRRTKSLKRRGVPITDAALDAFAELQRLEAQCSCEEPDWDGEYWKHVSCSACEAWWKQHSVLHHELKARIWDWPVIQHPNSVTPYPEGSFAADHWKPDLPAQRRYKMLADALAARVAS